ncbi:ribosome biogenesis GTP-binding protein YsxC [Candidatus Campbellbacteria bacterium RIFOXYC2_FULL_35_25]|uniref:Probable GTP-binding protein EngB n=1 Tax=Candidatus Campbellbacteria bacterium RIFOXYC2_FULL_35_25 TaxID=1797582 RepID=A0A1F5EI47_9BACT|nr:MAG: ribosome biogenesis GTP-binding protein YsxC [Candidatus Campbellbacteria bacterium RIFOXYC2_FULL_35_25]
MKTENATFIKGIRGTDDIIFDLKPKVAFIGRSNVGKSSVINSLVGSKKLVKSSSMPGKTREINFFLINEETYFVDLPGYGFAKIKSDQREKLRKLIVWYLFSGEAENKKVVLIIDFKIGPSEFDLEMLRLLQENNIDYIVVANKIDKISKGARIKQVKKIEKDLGEGNIILYSAKTGEGRDVLLNEVINF